MQKAKNSPNEMTFDELVDILEYKLVLTGCKYNIRLGKSCGFDYIRVSSTEKEKISVYHVMSRCLFRMSMSCEENPLDPDGFSLVFTCSCFGKLSLPSICNMTRRLIIGQELLELGDKGYW